MNFTDDFLQAAQDQVATFFRGKRDSLIEAHGRVEKDSEFKDDKTVVTSFDKQMELDLEKVLQKFDGSIGFEGEEFGPRGNRDTFWLVDPIDGTESFVRGLPYFRNMATLINDGRPLMTIVYQPVTDKLFTARLGKGTFRNGDKMVVSQRPLERVRIELGTAWQSPRAGAVFAAIKPQIEQLAAVHNFIYVVEAKLDAHLMYESDAKPWDNAARMLLLAETGAKVANLGKTDYDYHGGDWLAANPAVFDQLVAIIQKAETT